MKDYTDNAKRFRDISNAQLREVTALLEGRDLRFEVATIRFQANSPASQNRLLRVDIEYVNSESTF